MKINEIELTKEEVMERVVQKMFDHFMHRSIDDEDRYKYTVESEMARSLDKHVKNRIDETIKEMADKIVIQEIPKYIENLVLHETNRWGEKQGKSLTIKEYLTNKLDEYMTTKVNRDGKPDSYGGKTPVEWGLNNSFRRLLKDNLVNINEELAKSLTQHVEEEIKSVLKRIQSYIKNA